MDLEAVKYLSELGKLGLSDEEAKRAAGDMAGIIEILDIIKEADVIFDPLSGNRGATLNDLREDIKDKPFSTGELMKNAVNSDNCFVVPKVLE